MTDASETTNKGGGYRASLKHEVVSYDQEKNEPQQWRRRGSRSRGYSL
jgi:hypothetical protein